MRPDGAVIGRFHHGAPAGHGHADGDGLYSVHILLVALVLQHRLLKTVQKKSRERVWCANGRPVQIRALFHMFHISLVSPMLSSYVGSSSARTGG